VNKQDINEWLDWHLNDDRIINFFKNIKQNINNLIKWFPIIWNDRQWDHTFLLGILKFKLMLMSKFFKERAYTMNAKDDAANMDKCIYLLGRIIKDDYKGSYDHQDYMIKQDLSLLFEIMRKQTRSWWD